MGPFIPCRLHRPVRQDDRGPGAGKVLANSLRCRILSQQEHSTSRFKGKKRQKSIPEIARHRSNRSQFPFRVPVTLSSGRNRSWSVTSLPVVRRRIQNSGRTPLSSFLGFISPSIYTWNEKTLLEFPCSSKISSATAVLCFVVLCFVCLVGVDQHEYQDQTEMVL